MNTKIYRYFVILVVFNILNSCTQKNQILSRSYFTFDLEDRKLVVPMQLNDSIRIKMAFDTGFGEGASHMHIIVDSTILTAHSNLFIDYEPIIAQTGSSWGKNKEHTLIYNSNFRLKIGETDFTYDYMQVMNWKKHMNSNVSDGLFNIPENDSTHIWELNFENNYLEIHPANNYSIPKDCFIMSLGNGNKPFLMDFPMQVKFMDNDTLTINQKFLIDTGAAWDIVLLHKASELKFLDKREDAVWIKFLNSYLRYYTADVTLFDSFQIDSLRIYTIDYKNNISNTNYIIGLNFLKRFNVFFDMKNRQLGLQPIRNFQRLVNPLYERFHYSTQKTEEGKFIVDKIGNYKENYYKSAGLQIGDEIVAIDGIPYGETTREIRDSLKKQDTLTLEIIRSGKSLTLSVPIDPNEPKGD